MQAGYIGIIFEVILLFITELVLCQNTSWVLPGEIYGGFILTAEIKMNSSYAVHRLPNSSFCICKNSCYAWPQCLAYSLEPQDDGTKECHLSNLPPYDVTTEFVDGALYSYRYDSLLGSYRDKVNDRLYFAPHDQDTFLNAKGRCNAIPGFQLAICNKKEDYQALQHIIDIIDQDIWVDLEDTTGVHLWGDGTELPNLESFNLNLVLDGSPGNDETSYKMCKDDKFRDEKPGNRYYFLCQSTFIP